MASELLKLECPEGAFPAASRGLLEVDPTAGAEQSSVSLLRNAKAQSGWKLAEETYQMGRCGVEEQEVPDFAEASIHFARATMLLDQVLDALKDQINDNFLKSTRPEDVAMLITKIEDMNLMNVRALEEGERAQNELAEVQQDRSTAVEQALREHLAAAVTAAVTDAEATATQRTTREEEEEEEEEDAQQLRWALDESQRLEDPALRASTVQEALKEGQWVMIRNSGHKQYGRTVVDMEGKLISQHFTLSSTPSDHRSEANALAELRRNARQEDIIFVLEPGTDGKPIPTTNAVTGLMHAQHVAHVTLKKAATERAETEQRMCRAKVNEIANLLERLLLL
jgi:hypothetical protein